VSKLILQIEDDEHDVIFMKIAMQAASVKNPVAVLRDGREAMAYLKGEGKFANRRKHPIPRLVLLDLRLPYVPGLKVLQWIREQPALAQIPVIICSGSDQDSDVKTAYESGANGYIVKPNSPSALTRIVRCIKEYWLDMDAPPQNCKEWLAVNAGRPGRSSPFLTGSKPA
jgi:CheY-like chemotaxis protein